MTAVKKILLYTKGGSPKGFNDHFDEIGFMCLKMIEKSNTHPFGRIWPESHSWQSNKKLACLRVPKGHAVLYSACTSGKILLTFSNVRK